MKVCPDARVGTLGRLALVAGILFVPGVCSATTITISPPTKTVAVNDVFTLDVNISNVTDLAGYQFGVQFDGAMLVATSNADGGFFGNTTSFFGGNLNTSPGLTTFIGDLVSFGDPGVSGAGPSLLVTLGFKALAPGTGPVSLVFDSTLFDGLYDSAFDTIAFEAIGAGVTVVSPTAIPEPATLVMLLSGGAALIRARSRRSPQRS
jgi:Cohesin domain